MKKLPKVNLPADARLDTLAVREGLPPSQWGENSEALYLTSSFVHPDAATAAARFANEEEAFVYSRFSNPTVTMMERRLAALEGSDAAIGTASGMAAILLLIMGTLKSGDHVVCSQSVFGSTIKLFQDFAKYGVQTSFVSQSISRRSLLIFSTVGPLPRRARTKPTNCSMHAIRSAVLTSPA